MGISIPLVNLAIQALKLKNTKEARKYHDHLVKLKLKLLDMDKLYMTDPDQVDDVEWAYTMKKMELIAEAALNDPLVFGNSTSS